jgi:hypothetical protein
MIVVIHTEYTNLNSTGTAALELSQSLGSSLTWQGCDSPQDGASPILPTALSSINSTISSSNSNASTASTAAPHCTVTGSTTRTNSNSSYKSSSGSSAKRTGDAPVTAVASDVSRARTLSAVTAVVAGDTCGSDSDHDDDEHVQNNRCTSDVPMFEALLVIGVPQQWDLRCGHLTVISLFFNQYGYYHCSLLTDSAASVS